MALVWEEAVLAGTPEEIVGAHGLEGARALVAEAHASLTPAGAERWVDVPAGGSALCRLEALQAYCYGAGLAALCERCVLACLY